MAFASHFANARVSQHIHVAIAAVTKDAMLFPVAISAAGIVICILCGFVATNVAPVKVEADIERVLKRDTPINFFPPISPPSQPEHRFRWS